LNNLSSRSVPQDCLFCEKHKVCRKNVSFFTIQLCCLIHNYLTHLTWNPSYFQL
jgi:hypothetical protein